MERITLHVPKACFKLCQSNLKRLKVRHYPFVRTTTGHTIELFPGTKATMFLIAIAESDITVSTMVASGIKDV